MSLRHLFTRPTLQVVHWSRSAQSSTPLQNAENRFGRGGRAVCFGSQLALPLPPFSPVANRAGPARRPTRLIFREATVDVFDAIDGLGPVAGAAHRGVGF